MTFLQNYLNNPKVKKTLSLKYGEEGFSLIELVVVVAVLAVLSAVAIPQFTNISEKARAAAASNTVATVAKECAAKIADQGEGTYQAPISMSGYKDDPGGWYVGGDDTDDIGTKVEENDPDDPEECPEEDLIGLESEDESRYPSFYYNVETGEKLCAASGDAVARGCENDNW